MAIVLRKTAKGLSEIETRTHRLAPRLRSALIVIDGRRDTLALARLILQDAEATLRALLDQGFIEIVPGTAPAPAPAALPTTSAAAPAARATVPFEQRRREAVRALTDLVGPIGEALSLKMGRAKRTEELQPLVELAQQVIANTRGRQAAHDYGVRFGADADG
ncbi:MAG: hypothetical protein ABIX12_08605 [Rubrivivax sp.]